MKIDNLTNGLMIALLLASPIAGAETEYPASDFKPKVVYQDAGASSQTKSAPTAESSKQEKSFEVDSKYPAADFQPKVLYKDANYKSSKLPEVPASTAASSTKSVTSDVAGVDEKTAVKAEDQSSTSYLLGLVVIAVFGYLFFGKREQSTKSTEPPVYTRHVSGLSGVARYIRKHNMAAETGVARYLEKHGESEQKLAKRSGVEKYLEKQEKSAQEKAAQAVTGVEKYMRNRG
ncbi:MAG: hypothetical protein ACXWF8_11245 [Methylobacter sp.]